MRPPVAGRVVTALLLVLLGVWAVVLRPQSLGGPAAYIVVRGSSMLPTYTTGDLLIVRSAPTYGVGEVVAYRVAAGDIGAGHIVVHRIVGGDAMGGFLLQGDNNNSVDPWMPKGSDVVGREWVRVPGFGRYVALLHQPATLAALATAVIVALMAMGGPKPAAPKPVEPAHPATNRRHRRARPIRVAPVP